MTALLHYYPAFRLPRWTGLVVPAALRCLRHDKESSGGWDVEVDPTDPTVAFRREMETVFAPKP